MNRFRHVIVFLLMVFITTTGCKQTETIRVDPKQNYTLRVLYPNEKTFMERYGASFVLEHPNVSIQVIPFPKIISNGDEIKQYTDYIQQFPADLLYLPDDGTLYATLIRQNKLVRLDPLIKRDKLALSEWSPVELSSLQQGDGKNLYALSPYYGMNVLYYNKDLFDHYHVPYPESQMTLEEISRICEKFPLQREGSNRLIGVVTEERSNEWGLLLEIGKLQRLKMMSEDGSSPLLTSKDWTAALSFVVNGYRSGLFALPVLLTDDGNSKGRDDAFAKGQAAFYWGTIGNIVTTDWKSINWGMVTEPVNGKDRSKSLSAKALEPFAISADSTIPDVAWELLKSINSDATEKRFSDTTNSFVLMSRPGDTKAVEDHDVSALSKLKEVWPPLIEKASPTFFQSMDSWARLYLHQAIVNGDTPQEISDELQQKATELLKASP